MIFLQNLRSSMPPSGQPGSVSGQEPEVVYVTFSKVNGSMGLSIVAAKVCVIFLPSSKSLCIFELCFRFFLGWRSEGPRYLHQVGGSWWRCGSGWTSSSGRSAARGRLQEPDRTLTRIVSTRTSFPRDVIIVADLLASWSVEFAGLCILWEEIFTRDAWQVCVLLSRKW